MKTNLLLIISLLVVLPLLGQITYPVNKSDRFDIYKVSTGEIVAVNKAWPRPDGMPLKGADPDLVPLLRVKGPDPALDPETQRLARPDAPVIDLAAQTATYTRQVVQLSQGELDHRARLAAERQEKQQIKTIYNRLKQGTATNRQVQRVLARLLRDEYGDSEINE